MVELRRQLLWRLNAEGRFVEFGDHIVHLHWGRELVGLQQVRDGDIVYCHVGIWVVAQLADLVLTDALVHKRWVPCSKPCKEENHG